MATKFRNYFSGFSFLVGYQYGHFRSKEGERARPMRVVFSGNDSSYTRTLPIVYGRARVADPILLIAKPEGDFLTTLWAVSEGLLATNPADDTQTTPVNAYSASIDSKGNRIEHIYVNGESRHDLAPGFGIEVANGDQDRGEPIASFFPTDPSDFVVNHLGYWGTARVTFRISTKDHPSVDLTGGQVSGNFEVQFGRVHRVYSDATTYVLRATDDGINPGASPSFVQMDLLAAKRAGAGLDYARLNIQSFVDLAAYCRATVTNVFDGTSVKRWTWNGIIDQTKSLADWLHTIALGSYSLPPYADKDGLLKVRALKAEDTSSVPLFSSKVASVSGRNILWTNGRSSLVKSRRPITEIPNEIRANIIDKSYDPQYIATLSSGAMDATTDPISITVQWSAAAIASGTYFSTDDKIIIDSEQLWITKKPSDLTTDHKQTLHCQRAYAGTSKATHVHGSLVQFVGHAYAKIAVVVSDRDVQDEYGAVLGDQSRQVISKTIDLPGTTTEDEAARIATLIIRAGEFGQGGLANNNIVTFNAFYRSTEDLEIGDVIEVEDELLSPTDNEIFYRVLALRAMPFDQGQGAGIVFSKEIVGILHDNDIYDDTALSVSDFSRINGSGANDIAPEPVTNFGIAENGIFDPNNKPVTTLTFDYDEPDPLGNFRSVIIFRSSDDGGTPTSAPVRDWRYVTEVMQSGQTMQYPISGEFEWFCAVSRPMSGHTPNVDSLLADGSYKYPRVKILVDGVTDLLPAPGSPTIAALGNGGIQLKWLPYTGSNLALYKNFHVYRNSANDLSTATLLASFDGTLFLDSSVSASTTYWYWIVGFSILLQEGLPTAALTETASSGGGGAVDTAVPDAPVIALINGQGSYNTNEYSWLVVISKPGGAANWNSADLTTLQIATNSAFTAFPSGISLDGVTGGIYAGPPPRDIFFTTSVVGTYYIRAKLHNSFGDSAWSNVVIRSTNFFDNLAADSDIPPPPDALTVTTNATYAALGGNAFNVQFKIPSTNTQSYYGYSIYIHNSATLPLATKQYNSFSHAGVTGALTAGSAILVVAGSPGWTTDQWAGKDLVLFSSHRNAPGLETFDYEGQMFVVQILHNDGNTLTLDLPVGLLVWTMSGLGFYIVNRAAGEHFWEKLTFTTPLELNEGILSLTQDRSSRTRTALFTSSIPTIFAWVALYNLYGQGRLGSPQSATFSGLVSNELGLSSVINGKISGTAAGNGAVTEIKTNITALGNLSLNLGTVQLGTMQTASSGSRIVIDNTNGLRAFTGSTLRTQIPISGTSPGDVFAAALIGITNGIQLVSNNGLNAAAVSSLGVVLTSAAGVNLTLSASTSQANLSAANLNVLDGAVNCSAGLSVLNDSAFKPRYVIQSLGGGSTEPTMVNGEMLIVKDTDTNHFFILFKDTAGVYHSVQLNP